ncbi:MAG TPA: M20/M25/M40 family metallo-hydrolase, partial [Bryobacterales bacterium]|nr:M20/M25/M40 family metallo-hydrolase [Bryobacterales bacterium]
PSVVAQSDGVRECLQFFTREKRWITERHLELCRIPAPTFQEQERAAYLARALAEMGLDAQIDRAGNAVAPVVFDRGAPFLAVTAHMDTVLAPRNPSEIVLRPGGVIAGPGVSDNGAGLAALLAIAKALKSGPPLPGCTHNLLLAANVGEEGEGNLCGIRFLCQQSPYARRIAAFLVLDGAATDHITTQALGSRRFEVVITGPGGHSWNDFGMVNPVHALARAIAMFSDTALPHGSRSSINVGTIEGGSSINSIPGQARAKVDIRSESNAALEQIVAALEEAVRLAVEEENRRAAGSPAVAKVREIGSRPAAELGADSRLLACLRAVDAHLGIRSRLDRASTDANIPLSLGREAVTIGAGGQGGGAHTPSEWFNPEGRDLGLKRIFLSLALLLRGAAPPLPALTTA